MLSPGLASSKRELWSSPIADILEGLHRENDNPVGRKFAVAICVSLSMALDILDRAEREKKTKARDKPAVTDVCISTFRPLAYRLPLS